MDSLVSRSGSSRFLSGYKNNWEADIGDVFIEACSENEDPLGLRAVFVKDKNRIYISKRNQDFDRYTIGASYLKSRLERLLDAGFDAPMTKKALNLIDEERLGRISLMSKAKRAL